MLRLNCRQNDKDFNKKMFMHVQYLWTSINESCFSFLGIMQCCVLHVQGVIMLSVASTFTFQAQHWQFLCLFLFTLIVQNKVKIINRCISEQRTSYILISEWISSKTIGWVNDSLTHESVNDWFYDLLIKTGCAYALPSLTSLRLFPLDELHLSSFLMNLFYTLFYNRYVCILGLLEKIKKVTV